CVCRAARGRASGLRLRSAACSVLRGYPHVTAAVSTDLAAPRTRLALFLLFAPALIWLLGLIVLPHVDLAALSLRARVAPRTYEFSFANYRTFIDEPLYWHTFVRTAAMSIIATACTLAIGFPTALYIVKLARVRAKSILLVLSPRQFGA